MAIELERAYVFQYESVPHILKFLRASTIGFVLNIRDNYLGPDLRIRHVARDKLINWNTPELMRKSGDKKSGRRIEESRNIDPETAAILIVDSRLQVIKKRYNIHTEGSGFVVALDIVESPMKIAILEIESKNGQMPPTASEIFNVDLIECPLASWDLFRQKIGICGAPSSGKTETAKAP